jgi:catechol 2,3-dioxygenase-like lactoylglutathione lyase family enzyme
MADGTPKFTGVLETALYHSAGEKGAVEDFYGEVLGLTRVATWDSGIAFRVGTGVLLLFDRDRLNRIPGPISSHGSRGAGHACVLASAEEYETWRERVVSHGVNIVHDQVWDERMRSFYFRDPAGNLLEVASGDLWPS